MIRQLPKAQIENILVIQPLDNMPIIQQVGFELLGNLAGLKWSKKDLDLWHTAAKEVFKNRFEVLLIFAHS